MENISITKKMYGWTKYGGARKGLVKEELTEWYCQVCGEKHMANLPSYFIPEDDLQREFMRVCSWCKHQALVKKVETYQEMMALQVANLLSLPPRY